MVKTVLEARVDPSRWQQLEERYRQLCEQLSPQLLATSLLQDRNDRNVWRIATEWRSSAELAEYRASVDTPEGIVLFREVGSEPELTVFDVVARATGAGTERVSAGGAVLPEQAEELNTRSSERCRRSEVAGKEQR